MPIIWGDPPQPGSEEYEKLRTEAANFVLKYVLGAYALGLVTGIVIKLA